jgi:hypothetical protein
VIVDEAHHARRRDFLDLDRYRPNRMLELLNRLQHHTRGLLLMTATPMQVHPIEIWDLLNTLGLSGEWGAAGRDFLRFYEQLRHPPDETDWRFVFRMLRAELTVRGGTLEDGFAKEAQRLVGLVDWVKVKGLPQDQTPGRTLQDLPTQAQAVARRMVKAHTPLRRLTYRNTRDLLRRYHREGLLTETVPDRAPRPVWITMREEERALYNRIEEYITDFYRKYEDERKGLGFVMTVYRRRLTSSFYAIRRSLEKRLAFLRGRANLGLDEDDLEQEALNQDVDELGLDEGRTIFQEEIAYVEDFVHALGPLVGQDSKVAQLLTDLRRVFRQRDTVIVFTRYTDTMDFLREQLRPVYGAKVACYSGRGGERWDGMIWAPTTKETIKNAFREGEAIKILLCTEAASEGLNLQTCGVLINYDMPWNPMRVEQRIGRIDRIGQVYDEIWIRNYFYADTVEAKVHRALDQRIDWFQDVVGPLQPILAQVGQTIKTLTMTPQAERQRALHEALRQIEARLDTQAQGFDLDEWADQAEVGPSPHRAEGITKSPPPDTPITLADLAAVLTTAPTLKDHFRRHENIPNAYWVQHEGKRIAVTFDPETFDTYPATLRLLTYGSPLLEDLLARIPTLDEALAPDGRILRLAVQKPLPRVAYYALDADGGTPTRLERLNEVQAVLATPPTPTDPEWTEARVAAARRDLEAQVRAEWDAIARAEARLAHAQTEALRAEAGRLLRDAALVELARGRQPQLLRDETYPVAFNRQAVIGLKRYGYPWGPLLKIADDHIQDPRPTDPFFMKIQNDTPRQLRGHFSALTQHAKRLVQRAAQTLPG